jgi:hypothetical protein
MHPAALRTSCNSAMPGSEGFALVVTWLPFPIGNRSVRFWRRYLIRREIRAVCALVNDSASVVDGDAARAPGYGCLPAPSSASPCAVSGRRHARHNLRTERRAPRPPWSAWSHKGAPRAVAEQFARSLGWTISLGSGRCLPPDAVRSSWDFRPRPPGRCSLLGLGVNAYKSGGSANEMRTIHDRRTQGP